MKNELLAQVSDSFNNTFGSFSNDILNILILFIVFYLIGVFLGRAKLSAVMLSLYASSIAFLVFPYTYNVTLVRNVANANEWSALIIFSVFLVITFGLISKVIRSGEWMGLDRWLFTALYALIAVFQVIGLVYSMLPFKQILIFTPLLHSIFSNPITIFLFLFIPLVAIATSDRYY